MGDFLATKGAVENEVIKIFLWSYRQVVMFLMRLPWLSTRTLGNFFFTH